MKIIINENKQNRQIFSTLYCSGFDSQLDTVKIIWKHSYSYVLMKAGCYWHW